MTARILELSIKGIYRGVGMDAAALALVVLVFFAGLTLYYVSRYTHPGRKPPKERRVLPVLRLNVVVRRFVHSV